MKQQLNKPVLVIYHGSCSDGFGAAFAAWVRYGAEADYVAAHYGNEPPDVTGKDVFILDFSYPRAVLEQLCAKADTLVVLDHHQTAEKDLAGLDYAIFDMARSGAVIAWQYFNPLLEVPYGLQLIQDRDLWRFNLPETKAFGAALRAFIPFEFEAWAEHMGYDAALSLSLRGHDVRTVADKDVQDLAKRAHPISLNGFSGTACNAPPKHSSELGNVLAQNSGTFGLVYSFDGHSNLFQCSLRSIGDYDVSEIAKIYGGGGHKNAAGFSTNRFPSDNFMSAS